MKLRFIFILFIFYVAASSAQMQLPGNTATLSGTTEADTSAQLYSAYRLGSGDVINIVVFGEDDLSKDKIKLTDAGTISYSVLGEMRIQGLTVGELERLIADNLRGNYLVNPRVSVQVDEYRPFYINGMVEKPGSYPFLPGLTVRKAASLAGGLRERASTSEIIVIRDKSDAKAAEKATMDTFIYPGDIITVEESFF